MVNAANALNIRMRNAVAVATAAIPSVGPPASPAARRTGGAGEADPLTSADIRLLVYGVRTLVEVAVAAVRMPYLYVTHTNFFSLISIF